MSKNTIKTGKLFFVETVRIKSKKILALLLVVLMLIGMMFLSACIKSEALATPTIIGVGEESLLIWSKVENATEYIVELDGAEYTTSKTEYSLAKLEFQTSTCTIRVKAISDDNKYSDSNWSKPYEYLIVKSPIDPSDPSDPMNPVDSSDPINPVVTTVDRLLVIQRENEAVLLKDILDRNLTLSETGKIDVTSFSETTCPDTLEKLAQYDQVVLMNIANSDMPDGFVDILTQYVGELGGGLLTVGGNKDISNGNGTAKYANNTYNYDDMNGTDYAKLLPVEAIERYKQPVAVMFVVDVSTSMDASIGGETMIAKAKSSIMEALKSFGLRDYVGVVSFSEKAKTICDLTPASQRNEIAQKISTMSTEGGTYYQPGIKLAVEKLDIFKETRKKHVIFITDGKPSDYDVRQEPFVGYEFEIERLLKMGITMSAIDISSGSIGSAMTALIEIGQIDGFGEENIHTGISVVQLLQTIDSILLVPDVTSYIEMDFTPEVGNHKVTEGIEYLPKLKGYYGVDAKPNAAVPVMGENSPLYAQWSFGKGKVGSFMSDLDGTFSDEFFVTDNDGENYGETFILNIIKELFPSKRIQYSK